MAQRDTSTTSTGVVKAIAYRPTDGDPMRLLTVCRVLANRGIDLENRPPGRRTMTLLSAQCWADVCRELGVELPWYKRRANLLVDEIDLASTIGRLLMIGEVTVRIHGETKPCNLMDAQHAGLRAALVSECRGGVFGQVLVDGTIRAGDPVSIVPTG